MPPDPRTITVANLLASEAPLHVPVFGRLDDYVGVWAIEPKAGAALWEAARRTDLAAHVISARATPIELKSKIEMVRAKGGRQIAVIKVMGTLMKAESSMGDATSTVQLRRDVRDAAADPDVAAILLAIDSPGGSVAGTDDLANDVKAATKKKPVYAQVDDLCASAAYWVACQCDKVFANSPTALVGSIGTFLSVYDYSAAAEKEGVKALVFATGSLKGAGTPGAPVTEEQAAHYQHIVNESQKTFDDAVRLGRGLSDKQLATVRDGGVYPAQQALDRKLLDGIQTMEQTLDALSAEVRQRQQAARAEGPPQLPRAGEPPAPRTEVRAMFETWVASQGFDAATLNATQRAALERQYAREQLPAAALPAATPPAPAAPPVDLAAEVERSNEIVRLCQEAKLPTVEVEGKRVDLAAHAIRSKWTVSETRSAAQLEQLRAERLQGPGIISRGHDKDCTLEALQAAMVLRSRGSLDHHSYAGMQAHAMKLPAWMRSEINADARQRAMEWGHRYGQMSALDICREAIRLDGRSMSSYDRAEIIHAAFSGGSLTNIFTTSVNAVLLATYMDAPDTTQGWVREADVADFKTNDRINLTKGSSLSKLPRGSTADDAARSDQIESYKIARYAKKFSVDEQDMIDDMLNAFADMPVEMGNAARRLRPDLVYVIFLANPTLTATGIALFSNSNPQDNLLGSTDLSAAGLRTAISTQLLFQDNGINLNLATTHLVVPPTLKHLGRELIKSGTIIIAGTAAAITERGTINTIQEDNLNLVSDARLENGVTDPATGTVYSGSSTTWWVLSARARTIEVGYLRGTGRAPQVRSFVLDQGQWGMGWDINMDIGVKALDWRAFVQGTH